VLTQRVWRHLVPLLVTVLAFGGIFTAYQLQEFGNFAWEFFEPIDMGAVAVATDAVLGEVSETAKIFAVRPVTVSIWLDVSNIGNP